MHLDSEILYIVVTVALFFILGIPRIRRNVFIPRDLQFQEVPAAQLTAAQSEFLNSYDQQLARLNYYPFTTFRVPNMLGHNLIRIYLNAAEPAKCALTMVASKNKSLFSAHIEFATRYSDGTRLVVNNNSVTGVLNDLPGVIFRRCGRVTDLGELKRRHDAEAQELSDRGVIFYTRDNYFDDFRQYHVQYCEHQAEKGLLRWDAGSGVYRATTSTALRGIGNFLNPMADNSSVLRFVAGLLLGGGLPILWIMERGPISRWVESHGPDGPFAASLLPMLVYGLAGLSIGLFFSRRTFIWGVLLGMLPSRVLFGFAEAGYGLWMASVAGMTGRARNRGQNVL
jgi:hypothetical protein